ncbi:MAG TPA: winged helix DNA-binding protein [Puia sp.]|nr:winged helix DNA-binding protein [Puia sp.]
MNQTVELVTAWANFEESHPQSSVADFCRYYLINKREQEPKDSLMQGVVPPIHTGTLMKLMTLIVRIFNVYFEGALKDAPVKQTEQFYFLTMVKNLGLPKKTEVIYSLVSEVSNGLNILNHLIKQKYISEHSDPEDKRSIRVKVTPKGEKVLRLCYEKIHLVCEMMFMDMPEDDIRLCIQMMKNVEAKFAGKWMQQKTRPFQEIFENITGKKATLLPENPAWQK